MERAAFAELEAGRFETLTSAITSPSWGITRAALAACEFRTADENGIPVAPRALEAAVAVLGRTVGATVPDAVLARVRALRIRDNAFIQIDTPPPLGLRYSMEDFERAYMERDRRPHQHRCWVLVGVHTRTRSVLVTSMTIFAWSCLCRYRWMSAYSLAVAPKHRQIR